MQPIDVFKQAYADASPELDVILVLFTTRNPEKFGMVSMDSELRVLGIIDKPKKTDLTEMWGCIIWRPKFTEFFHKSVQEKEIFDFAQIMNNAIHSGMNFKGFFVDRGVYIDLGTYDEIMAFDRNFRET